MLKMSKGAAKQKDPIQTKANSSLEKSNKPETQKQQHRPQTETENRPQNFDKQYAVLPFLYFYAAYIVLVFLK
jgi:hypothetical protein